MITSALKRTAKVAALTVTFAASGSGLALASTAGHTSGNNSILGGNQLSLPVSIPVAVCGNAIAILGDALGMCRGTASVSTSASHDPDGGSSARTSGNGSVLGGNQVSAPVSVPVSVCGNAVAVLGHARAACKGGASVSGSGGSGATTSGNGSILGGNQATVPISVPISVCGNSVAVLGVAASQCNGGSSVGRPPHHHHHHQPPPCRCHHHHGHHHHGRHHHEGPPPAHHHHGGTMTPPASTTTGSRTLPTTGANFVGLLALAGSFTVAGGTSLLARRRLALGLLAIARRATRGFAAAR